MKNNNIKNFEKYNNELSQDDYKKMIDDILYKLPDTSPELLKLIFINGGKLDKNESHTHFINLPINVKLKLNIIKALIEYGGEDINKKIYWSGLYPSVTALTLITLLNSRNGLADKKDSNHFYKLVIGLIKLGGDMKIKDFNNKSAYDYLSEKNVEIIDKSLPGFKENYDIYMKIESYNLKKKTNYEYKKI